jgi:hypothetical protein
MWTVTREQEWDWLDRSLAPVADIPAALADLRLTAESRLTGLGREPLPVTRSFLSDLNRDWLGLPGVPVAWYRSDDVRREWAARINRHLAESRRTLFVRVRDGRAVSPHSPRYASLTSRQVVSVLREAGDLRLLWAHPAHHTFDIALRWEEAVFALNGEDVYCGGIHVRNSETGHGRLRVSAYLYREACANGTIIGMAGERTLLARVHRDELGEDDLRQAVAQALAHLPRLGRPLQRLQRRRATLSLLSETLRQVGRVVGPAGAGRLAEHYRLEPGISAYGLFNAVTHWAQSYPGARRRYLEQIAGGMLTAFDR